MLRFTLRSIIATVVIATVVIATVTEGREGGTILATIFFVQSFYNLSFFISLVLYFFRENCAQEVLEFKTEL